MPAPRSQHAQSQAPVAPFDFFPEQTELENRVMARASIHDYLHVGYQLPYPQLHSFYEGFFYLRDANHGSRLSKAANKKRYPNGLGGIFSATPVVSGDKRGWLPVRGHSFAPDPRWETITDPGGPAFAACSTPRVRSSVISTADPVRKRGDAQSFSARMPGGSPGLVIRGSEERSQELIILPSWSGVLVTDHRSQKPHSFSTLLMDVDGAHLADGKAKRKEFAGSLSDIAGVEKTWLDAKKDTCSGALWWSHRGDGRGRGLFRSRGKFGRSGAEILGYASTDGGGPITAGGPGCRHRVHTSPGEVTNQGHLALSAPWWADDRRDGPLLLDSIDKLPGQMGGMPWDVKVRWGTEDAHEIFGARGAGGLRPGYWYLQTHIPIYQPPIIDIPLPPPPPNDQPPRIPLPPRTPPPIGDPIPPLIPLDPIGDPFIPVDPLPGDPVIDDPGNLGLDKPCPRSGPTPEPRVITGGSQVSRPATSPVSTVPRNPCPKTFGIGPTVVRKLGLFEHTQMVGEWAAMALAFVPRHSQREDLRYISNPDPRKVIFQSREAPVVMRLDVIAAEKGAGYDLENEKGAARYRAGDGWGGVIYMPSHYDVDYIDSGLALPTTSKERTLALWDIQLGFGRLGRRGSTSGLPVESYVVRKASGELVISYYDAIAVETAAMAIKSDGCVRFEKCVELSTFYDIRSEGLAAGFSLQETGTATELLNITGTLANLSPVTGGLLPPEGTTAQRSSGPGNWETRSNSTTGALEAFDPAGAGTWRDFSFVGGPSAQTRYESSYSSVQTGTTAVPVDDTVPLVTEGDEYMALGATTPAGTARVQIRATAMVSTSSLGGFITAFIVRRSRAASASFSRPLSVVGGSFGKLTSTAGDFVSDGFRAGMKVQVSGTAFNDGAYTIQSVTALSITTTATLTSEGPNTLTFIYIAVTDALAASTKRFFHTPVYNQISVEYTDVIMSSDISDIFSVWALRIGGSGGTTTFNGFGGARLFGNTTKSKISMSVEGQ